MSGQFIFLFFFSPLGIVFFPHPHEATSAGPTPASAITAQAQPWP
jgi:hypothetical protein